MLLVLCNPADEAALWAAQGLSDRGQDVEVVAPAALLGARRWVMRQEEGEAIWQIDLEDGRELRSDRISGALNRVTHVPGEWFGHVAEGDLDYAVQEWFALFLAFLGDIPGMVLNAPSPRWLAGRVAYEAEWHCLASRSGLPIAAGTWSVDGHVVAGAPADEMRSVLVVGDWVCAADHRGTYDEQCVKLAQLAGCSLLEVMFAGAHDADRFVGATPFADLHLGGEAGLDHLCKMFRDGARSTR